MAARTGSERERVIPDERYGRVFRRERAGNKASHCSIFGGLTAKSGNSKLIQQIDDDGRLDEPHSHAPENCAVDCANRR